MSMTPFVYEIFIKGEHFLVSDCLFIPFHLHSAIKLAAFPLGHSQHHFSWEWLGLGNCLLSAGSSGGFFSGSGWIRWIRLMGREGSSCRSDEDPHASSSSLCSLPWWSGMGVALEEPPLDTPNLYSETWGDCQSCDGFFLSINLIFLYLFYYAFISVFYIY